MEILERLRVFPLSWLSLAFLSGVLLAAQVTLSAWQWLGAAGLCLLAALLKQLFFSRLAFLKVSPSSLLLVFVSLTSFFLGAARYQAGQPAIDPFHIAWYNDRAYEVLVTGTLVEPPDYRDTYTNLRLRAEAIDTGSGDLPVDGLVLARVWPNETYQYGERVRLRGQLLTPPENEDFSYRDYLAGQGIHAYMTKAEVTRLPSAIKWYGTAGNPIRHWLYALKERALDNIYILFSDPEASLLAGILLGVDTGLPKDLQQAFKDTGTAHIIAISGFNIAIIAGSFFALFSRVFGQVRGSLFAILGIAFYTFLVGADAAVVRAAIMGSLSLMARLFGRRNDGLNALLASAALMTLANPHTPWDVGFQLSFFATLGLILYAEPFQAWAERFITRYLERGKAQKVAALLSEYVLLTLAAQLTTLPIMAWHFKRISLVSLIANPFILPVQPAVMILGGIVVLLSLMWLPLGQMAALAAWPFIAYTIRLVELFDRLPHGVIVLGNFSFWLAALFYLALLTWTLAGSRLREFLSNRELNLPPLSSVTVASALAALVILTWRAALTAPDGRLHLTLLDVGSADAILIQTPGGRYILVNGGPSASLLSDGLGRRLPPLGRRLDWLVVASTQENQVSGLPRVMQRIPPKNVLWAGNVEASYAARTLNAWLTEQSIPLTRAKTGMELDLGQGAVLRVLNVNSRGAVLLLEWGAFRALLPIGINFEALEELDYGKAIGKTSLLLLGDSGYAPISPPEWIASLNPQVILLSVAAGDKDGLPHQALLESIEDYPLLRTDRNGWIEVTTDGEQMWVRVEEQAQGPAPTAPKEQETLLGQGVHKAYRPQLPGK